MRKNSRKTKGDDTSMKNIKEIAKEYKEKNGNEKITNKELLWFVVAKFDTLENRITKTETKVKMMMWFVPVTITGAAIIIGVM